MNHDLGNIREEGQGQSAAAQPQSGQQASSSRGTRRGFAGNAAFQSAMARKQGDDVPPRSTHGLARSGHARRISLQSKGGAVVSDSFAGGAAVNDAEDGVSMIDDGASTASFSTDAAFDPTRRAPATQRMGGFQHLRAGSEMPANLGRGQADASGLHGRTISLGQHQLGLPFQGFVNPQQAAIQQQLDVSLHLFPADNRR